VCHGQNDLNSFLRELSSDGHTTKEISFTGGESFVNPELISMIHKCLEEGYQVLILTNAMRPIRQNSALYRNGRNGGCTTDQYGMLEYFEQNSRCDDLQFIADGRRTQRRYNTTGDRLHFVTL
jgi:organic radical activating enzyme